LFEVRLGFAKSVASQNEFRGCDGHGRDPRLFEGGGEEPGAEAFAEGSEAIEEIRAGGHAGVNGNFVKKIASEQLQFAADAKVIVFSEVQIMKHIEMQIEDELCFTAGGREFAIGESTSNGKKMIGDTFHRGNDDSNTGGRSGGVNEASSMEHAARTKKRTAAKLEGDDTARLLGYPASVVHTKV
jgi:hypothetical protein